MKKIILLIMFAFLGSTFIPNYSTLEAKGTKSVSVKSYKKKNGTTVKSHKRSKPSKKKR